MPTLTFKAPLIWPEGLPATPRTSQRNDHGFSPMTLAEAVAYLEEELQDLTLANATLYLDTEQPLVDRLRKKVGSRTGACLQFRLLNKAYVLTCDRWQLTEHNVYALHLAFRHWRNIERWGVGTLPMLLSGFEVDRVHEATEEQAQTVEPWMNQMGLGPTSTLEDAIAIYHRRAKMLAHNSEELTKLNILMEEIRAYFASKG